MRCASSRAGTSTDTGSATSAGSAAGTRSDRRLTCWCTAPTRANADPTAVRTRSAVIVDHRRSGRAVRACRSGVADHRAAPLPPAVRPCGVVPGGGGGAGPDRLPARADGGADAGHDAVGGRVRRGVAGRRGARARPPRRRGVARGGLRRRPRGRGPGPAHRRAVRALPLHGDAGSRGGGRAGDRAARLDDDGVARPRRRARPGAAPGDRRAGGRGRARVLGPVPRPADGGGGALGVGRSGARAPVRAGRPVEQLRGVGRRRHPHDGRRCTGSSGPWPPSPDRRPRCTCGPTPRRSSRTPSSSGCRVPRSSAGWSWGRSRCRSRASRWCRGRA